MHTYKPNGTNLEHIIGMVNNFILMQSKVNEGIKHKMHHVLMMQHKIEQKIHHLHQFLMHKFGSGDEGAAHGKESSTPYEINEGSILFNPP